MADLMPAGGVWPAIEWPLVLSTGLVHLIRVRLDLTSAEVEQLSSLLSEDEQQRAARFRFDQPRQRFVGCRAALRQLLGRCCDRDPRSIALQYGLHGKPELCRTDLGAGIPRLEFSVSHSGEWALMAITVDSIVGVDIEECNPAVKTLKLAERFFAAPESAELNNLAADKQLAGFYRGWTSKEAYIKATGRGLSLSLSSFCVTIDPDRPASLWHVDEQPEGPARWTMQAIDAELGYAATVIVDHPNSRFVCWDWTNR